jgi:segregation and condensation protein B
MADDGRARNFTDLDIRETQEALAEELEAMADDSHDEEEAARADPVWSAAEMAGHLRMTEALLFAAAEPLDEEAIAARLPAGADVKGLLETLERQYENRGVILSKAGGKYRFITAPDVAPILETEKVEPKRLSRAALETLAIIAYHQPCTRADIEDVRGVAVSPGSLDQLMEIGWVRMRGRRRTAPGRPILYGTTQAFLEHFNLESVSDLPGMADLKAAGLLDARLPPGFVVPAPTDDLADADIEEVDAAESEFVTDFQPDDADDR